jgi:acyl carrier protein
MSDTVSLTQEVSQWLGEILRKEVDPARLDADLVGDYGADSMDMVDIAEALERKYGIIVSNNEISELCTLQDVVLRIQAAAS